MDDAGGVGVAQRIEHTLGELEGAAGKDLAAVAQHVAQGVTVNEFHDDVRHLQAGCRILRLTSVIHGDDVRVVEARSRLCLTLEPRLEGVVAGEVGAQPLDRDVATETVIAGPPDIGHAATADEVLQFVTPGEPTLSAH